MKEQLQIIVIGPGRHATEHLIPQIIAHPGARITGLVGRDREKLSTIAERYAVRDFSDDWGTYLRSKKIDAVVISATPQVHASLLQEIIPLGIPTYVEKPPAPNLETLIQ